jgi:hypothetical protein
MLFYWKVLALVLLRVFILPKGVWRPKTVGSKRYGWGAAFKSSDGTCFYYCSVYMRFEGISR